MTGIKHKIFIPSFTILIALYMLLGFVACKRMQAEPQKKAASGIPVLDQHTSIDAGKRIGKINIGMDTDRLEFLGEPDVSDAAMGKAWLTWYSKNSHAISGKYELNIFTSYKNPELTEKEIRCVRVTSPDFKTPTGLATNVDSSSVFKLHPQFEFIGTYTEKRTMPPIAVYADTKSGIAIELDRSTRKTSAVIIFSPDRGLLPDYGYFRPDLKRG